MGIDRMKIGVLTSSRADIGIYSALLRRMENNPRVDGEIIAFGSHHSAEHGSTIEKIRSNYSSKIHELHEMPNSDQPVAISKSYGDTVRLFSDFWCKNHFDWVVCLGDRFEMSAAVQAAIPFGLKLAHIHGGETTSGAIDNIYRHQISLASCRHFVSTELFAERVRQLTNSESIWVVGAPALEGLDDLDLPDWEEMHEHFDLPNDEYVLVTIHPETVAAEKNRDYAAIFFQAIESLVSEVSFLITHTNSDTYNNFYNERALDLKQRFSSKIHLQPSLGKLNYFRAITNASAMLGNSSSSIIEAASFNQWAVNVGNRQGGRPQSGNIINVEFNTKQIVNATRNAISRKPFTGENIYVRESPSLIILNNLLNE